MGLHCVMCNIYKYGRHEYASNEVVHVKMGTPRAWSRDDEAACQGVRYVTLFL